MSTKSKNQNRFPVKFGVDPEYLIAGLTTDVTTLECVLDLVDNSIDAARNEILSKRGAKKDQFGLPKSYAGYEIVVNSSLEAFEITDNCSGITQTNLSESSFVTGSRSRHQFGIGHFGVGLNRSIFKIGTSTALETDDGSQRIHLSFTEQEVRSYNRNNSQIFAASSSTSGKKFFKLTISALKSEVAHEVSSPAWKTILKSELSMRYGRFIGKGLTLKIGSDELVYDNPAIKQDCFFEPLAKHSKLPGNVGFFLEAGVHDKYVLSTETESALGKNRNELSNDYGWYVICNDRIILAADASKITGWDAKWHNEYNGFVGNAYFVSEDPSKLPWDSRKTSINHYSIAYREALPLMKEAAEEFRSKNRARLNKIKKAVAATKSAAEAKKAGNGQQANSKTSNQSAATKNAVPHNSSLPTVFLPGCGRVSTSLKIAALVTEAENTEIEGFPHRASMMLRSLFEHVLIDYLRRHRHFGKIQKSIFDSLPSDKQNGLKPGKISPKIEQIISWTSSNPDVWPPDTDKLCNAACRKYLTHLPKLNGVVHDLGTLTNEASTRIVRDDLIDTLITLLAH